MKTLPRIIAGNLIYMLSYASMVLTFFSPNRMVAIFSYGVAFILQFFSCFLFNNPTKRITEEIKRMQGWLLIEKMPAKYGTYLEEAGANLSGGEKQRLALARALIKNPEILILDEATSNLDFVSEAQIYETLNNLKCTTIIIAHRLSTIKRCDKIYVIDDSSVAESGTFNELVNKNGLFLNIWNSQVGEDISQTKTYKKRNKKKSKRVDDSDSSDDITYQ